MLCAWTASLRSRHGFDCCQVLGLPANPAGGPAATMIVPASQDQRLQPLPESALFAAREYVLRSGANFVINFVIDGNGARFRYADRRLGTCRSRCIRRPSRPGGGL